MTKMIVIPKQGAIATLADIRPMLPVLYSASSAEAMASTLERALRLTGSRRLSQIPANVTAWEKLAGTIVWTGEFRAPTLAKAKQNRDKFVARVSAMIRRAHAFASPAAPTPVGLQADWDALTTFVADNAGLRGPDGKQLINSMSPVSVATLRARLDSVSPQAVTTDVARTALIAAPAGKRASFRRSIRFLNGLIDTRDMHQPIISLLPTTKIGAMPILREPGIDWALFGLGFIESRDAAIEAAMRPEARERGKDRFGGRLGRPGLRGAGGGARRRRKPVRNRKVARTAHLAALSWLARHAYRDATALAGISDVHELLTEENVTRALQVYVERASASDVLKTADETSSLTTWLSNLATLARRGLRDEDLGWDIDDKKFEEGVETYAAREMSVSRATFVRLIDYDPSVARNIVIAPQTLHAEAMRGMERWDELGEHARIEVLHILMAAAMWALQIGRPLRTKNLNELTHEGADAQINAPRSKEADPFMFISRAKVKNRRDIEGRIHAAYWEIVADWIKIGRGKYLEINEERGFADNDYLFPGAKGALSRGALNKVWNRSIDLLGIPRLTPHMMRHVVATLHLAVHPGDYAVVAALLCDSFKTVEKFYARGEGRAAADLFIKTLAELHPDVAALFKKAA